MRGSCQSTSVHPVHPEECPTISRPANTIRHFFQTCQTQKRAPPSFHTAPNRCARPPGGCLAGPAVPNPINHTFILCRCCSAGYQTAPGHVWRTPPVITFQPMNSLSLCKWLLLCLCPVPCTAPFCWCHYLHLHQLF